METLIFLLKASAVLGLFYVTYQLFLRKETHFNALRGFLISGILASLLLPFWYFTTITIVEIPMISEPLVAQSYEPVITNGTTNTVSAVQPIRWELILLYIYSAVVVLLSLRFFFQLGQLLRLISIHPSRQTGKFRYVEMDESIPPFSFFNYIFYNPKAHSEAEMKMILKHEEVHAFQWHSVDILLANLLIIIQWFNPFAWLYKKSINENLEFLADEGTISEVPSKKAYQLALVKASSHAVPALATSFYQSFIKKRIIMLNKQDSRRTNLFKAALIIPLLAVFLYSFNIKEETVYKEVPIPGSTPMNAGGLSEVVTPEPTKAAITPVQEESSIVTLDLLGEAAAGEKPEAALVVDIVEPAMLPTISSKDIKFTINKDTTDAELENLKKELKEVHDVKMNYSVSRNNAGEITAISFTYSNGERNGSYNISGDEPIDEFVFYMDEDGDSGFWSEAKEARRLERETRMAERMNERAKRLAVARVDRDAKREEIIIEREARREEMSKRRAEMRDLMRDKEVEIIREKENDQKKYEEAEIRYKIARGNNQATILELESGDDGDLLFIDGEGGLLEKREAHLSGHAIVIDKDTTDQDLVKIKSRLADKGITFKYSKVKRNSAGELTRIKLDVNNNKGGKQTIMAKSDDGDPIDELIIDLN